MSLTSFKRRWIENWCHDVHAFIKDGSMCTMTGAYHEEDPHIIPSMGVPCCGRDIALLSPDSCGDSGRLSVNGEKLLDSKSSGSFPAVRLSYCHVERRKINRLVNGLPIIHRGITDSPEEIRNTPLILSHQPKIGDLTRRCDTGFLHHQLSKAYNLNSLQNCSSPPNPTRTRNGFSPNRSVTRARQKLLHNSMNKSRQFDRNPPSCWTAAEISF